MSEEVTIKYGSLEIKNRRAKDVLDEASFSGVYKGKGVNSIVMKNTFILCTKCREILPIGQVGLRHMGAKKGEVRNQAQCKKCRSSK